MMFEALLWKDIRIQRVAMLAAICVIAAPYAYAAYSCIGDGETVSSSADGLRASLVLSGRITLMVSLMVLAMLAGAAFAAERSDRSHEFLAVLPSTRFMILGSKALVVAAVASALWLLNPYVIIKIATIFSAGSAPSPLSIDATFGTVSAMALSVLGSGWFGSILVANPASSLLIGLLSPFLSLLLAFGICDPAREENAFRITFVYGCLVIGMVTLLGGTAYFFRREEV